MAKKIIEIGDIRQIYNIAGFEVCKTTSDKKEEIEWTPVEKINEAEVLSFIYRRDKTKKKTSKKKVEEPEEDDEEEIDDEDL